MFYMEKPLDKINLAFNGFFGESMGEKTRKRIHWIMSNVKGNKVLDVGCSQGITSILLGREGKKVIGIDALAESIRIAKEELNGEEEATIKNVTFYNENIITSDEVKNWGKFDTIILGEILEHFADGDSLLKKSCELGTDETIYIITVPFGINDYFDHKKTYYYSNFYREVNKYFDIEQTSFMGKWIGIIARKSKDRKNKDINFDIQIISELERNFYQIERDLLESNKKLKEQLTESNKRLENLKGEININKIAIDNVPVEINKKLDITSNENRNNIFLLKEKFNSYETTISKLDNNIQSLLNTKTRDNILIDKLQKEIYSMEEDIKLLSDEKEKLNNTIENLKKENATISKMYDDYLIRLENGLLNISNSNNNNQALENEINQLKSKLNIANRKYRISINNEKKLTNNIENLKNEKNIILKTYNEDLSFIENELYNIVEEYSDLKKIENKYKILQKKYNSLSKSKLGKITLKYWELKRSIKSDEKNR